MVKRLLLAVVLILGFHPKGQACEVRSFYNREDYPRISIKEAVYTAQLNNPRRQLAENGVESARLKHQGAKADFSPKLDLSNNAYLWSRGDAFNKEIHASDVSASLNLRLSQTLYDSGVRSHNLEAAKLRLEKARQSARSQKQALMLDTAQSYVNVLRLRHQLDRAIDLYCFLKDFHKEAEQGEFSSQDLNQIESSILNSSSRKHQIIASHEKSENSFRRVVRVDITQRYLIRPEPLYVPETSSEALTLALAHHPEILELRQETLALIEDSKSARAQGGLKIEGYAQSGMYYDRNFGTEADLRDSSRVGIQLSLSLFDGGRKNYKAQGIELQKSDVRLRQQEVKGRLEEAILNIYIDIENTRVSIENLEESIAIDRSYLQEQYRDVLAGTASVNDFLINRNNLYFSQVALQQEQFALLINTYNLHAQMGILMQTLVGEEAPHK